MNKDYIRNFCILAHIDHGKSTLADRFLEFTGSVEKRKMREQYLDMHPLEREKGITIKMQPVRMIYKMKNSAYILNLIDTPGHVDFTYEVSRALAAVEGAILLVDATQGVQAQTIANLSLAQKEGVVIIPVINKIDLPSADVARVEDELVALLNVNPKDIYRISAKMGTGIEELLQVIIEKVPAPNIRAFAEKEEAAGILRGLIFDSKYDSYQGVIAHVRIMEGAVKKSEPLLFMVAGVTSDSIDVGVFLPEMSSVGELATGEIGYIATGIKEPEKVRVGDTITSARNPAKHVLSGYKEVVPMIYISLFPEDQDDYDTVRESLKKLKLEDAALVFEPEESSAFGRGFRVGLLGMLHMEIISERLRREYGLELVFSAPSVAFKVFIKAKSGEIPAGNIDSYKLVYSAAKMPPDYEIEAIEEPTVSVEVITPKEYLGALASLIHEHGGIMNDTLSLAGERLAIRFVSPLREIIVDFYDELKSVTKGFASMAYEVAGYTRTDLVRLDVMVAGEKVGALSEIVPREKVYHIARTRLQKLKDLLPKELFAIAIQAEVEGRIIARETIPAMRKDVTGYLYGGDRTRKMKLWKKQKKGKKRLKEMARVEISPDIFIKLFKK